MLISIIYNGKKIWEFLGFLMFKDINVSFKTEFSVTKSLSSIAYK